ncbi:MAG: hypothetical protein C4539_19000 [Ignavibacteriales bacterium]|nr:MAG: hypothetical protein C4539_19000 [Ignavibacteriales bacterium]
MKLKLLIVLALILLSGIFEVVKTEIRYVSKTSSSTPPYTSWQTAADSIQKCINICKDGDTVVVANSKYKETLWIDKAILLLGSSIDSTIIDGTGLEARPDDGYTGITVNIKSDVRIENLKIIGKGIFEYIATSVVRAYNYPLKIKYCNISNAFEGVTFSHRSGTAENLFIQNVTNPIEFTCKGDTSYFNINNNLIIMDGDHLNGISNDLGGHAIIHNNVVVSLSHRRSGITADYYIRSADIRNNLITGFQFSSLIFSAIGDSVSINNNIASYTVNIDAFGIELGNGNKVSIRNNIVEENPNGLVIWNGKSNSDYNIYWGNKRNIWLFAKYGLHDIKKDPMFVKDTIPTGDMTFDLHLQKYSPAIDAGDPSILDKDGSRSDIGMYGGPYGESYTYQDLAPKPPANLTARVESNVIFLKWLKSTEADFGYYKVYRDTIPDFIYDSTKAISKTADTLFAEAIPGKGKTYYYKVTAFDKTNHQSPASEEVSVVITGVDKPKLMANDYMLYQNYPNPFNPSTTISYRLKERGKVILSVYDIQGKIVTQLINRLQESGYYEVEFSPDKMPNKTASGLYVFFFSVTDLKGKPVFTDMKKSIYL